MGTNFGLRVKGTHSNTHNDYGRMYWIWYEPLITGDGFIMKYFFGYYGKRDQKDMFGVMDCREYVKNKRINYCWFNYNFDNRWTEPYTMNYWDKYVFQTTRSWNVKWLKNLKKWKQTSKK